MYDVAIVGGGVCGCSLLYELSRYRLRTLLVEKENDVGVGTTKANSAIVHAGYDPKPGTLMARYNVEGSRLVEELCGELDILYRKCGSLVVGFDEADRATIEKLYARGVQNGVEGLRILDGQTLREKEPGLNPAAQCALYAPSAAVVNPWELASAQAEQAVLGGAEVWLDAGVQRIERADGHFVLHTAKGSAKARYLVNAAGTHAALVDRMAGEGDFEILPSRGEYHLLDTTQGELVNHVVFQCPTKEGKGVLVAPTVHGNLITGPNAQNAGLDDVATTREGLSFVKALALRSVPGIRFAETIRNFAGLRAVADTGDFVVGEAPHVPGYYRIAGIKSPGLSCAPAVAKDVVRMLQSGGLALTENPEFKGRRRVVRFKYLNAAERDAVIRQNPRYGTIVCRCETVTEGEVVDALRRPLPPRSLDAVKRRCGPGMGRCQGGFCGPRVQALIAEELGVLQQDVPQDRTGMDIVTGRTKETEAGGGEQA